MGSLSPRDRWRSSVICEELRVEPLLLHVEESLELVRASSKDPTRTLLRGGVLVTSSWEETWGRLGGEVISPGLGMPPISQAKLGALPGKESLGLRYYIRLTDKWLTWMDGYCKT